MAPLIVAVLFHTGTIGVRGALIGATVMLVCLLAMLWTFARSWWSAIGAPGEGASTTPKPG